MSVAVSFVQLCGRKERQGVDISSGDISLDIRTSDIGGLRHRTFGALATNAKEQENPRLPFHLIFAMFNTGKYGFVKQLKSIAADSQIQFK